MAGENPTASPSFEVRAAVLSAAFVLGFSCVITQLTLMREMLALFAGNELVLGIILGNWLLLMGAGATLGRTARVWRRSLSLLAALMVGLAVLPPLQIVVVRGLREMLFLRGQAVGVAGTVLASLGILLPYCVAAGAALVLTCRVVGGAHPAAGAGRIYTMDSVGSVAGGALFSFVLVLWLDHVALSVVPALLCTLTAAWLGWHRWKDQTIRAVAAAGGALAGGAALLAWIFLANPDLASTARQFPGQRILFKGSSPYGRLVVTESGGQTNFFENGLVIASTPDIEQAEESAHFALAQRPDADRVLLIGGALSGAAREVLRYGVSAVDCVELDPLLTAVGRRFLPGEFGDPRLRFLEGDARQFVRRTGAKYDVVIVALPDPGTAQLNRFFTHEFIRDVRRVLHDSGVLAFAVGRYQNYAGVELSRLLSCARQTVARSFRNVLLIPAGRVYFLASEGPLTTRIVSVLEQHQIETQWVRSNYLSAVLAPSRLADVDRAAELPAPVNRDFVPVLYYLQVRHWASQFEEAGHWLLILLAAAASIYVARLPPVAGALFASGFAGSTLEVVLLLAMQALAGSVYRQVGWVITLFMAGLAAGAWLATRRVDARPLRGSPGAAPSLCSAPMLRTRSSLGLLALAIALLAALLPLLLRAVAGLASWRGGASTTQLVLLAFAFALAALVGAQFPIATLLLASSAPNSAPHESGFGEQTSSAQTSAPGRLYTADFVGASLGALLAGGWLVPLMGISGVCWIAAGLNLLGALSLFVRR